MSDNYSIMTWTKEEKAKHEIALAKSMTMSESVHLGFQLMDFALHIQKGVLNATKNS
jgi:hypothetical protein